MPPETSDTVFNVAAAETGQRADLAIGARLAGAGLTRSAVRRLINGGHVRVNGQPIKASQRLRAGDEVAVRVPPPVPATPEPQAIPLDVVYEDGDIIVIDKPAGLVVHPAPGNPDATLVNALLAHCQDLSGVGGVRRPGIVHRIDKNTTGLLVVAKNDMAHLALKEQLARRELKRIYLALVAGELARDRGVIEAPIGRDPRQRTRMAVRSGGRAARTSWRVARRLHGLTLLNVELDTGRSHQIRVHCAHAGHPVIGDPDYGLNPKQAAALLPERAARLRQLIRGAQRQMLHAMRLELTHPRTGGRHVFEAPPPADFQRLLNHLHEAE